MVLGKLRNVVVADDISIDFSLVQVVFFFVLYARLAKVCCFCLIATLLPLLHKLLIRGSLSYLPRL